MWHLDYTVFPLVTNTSHDKPTNRKKHSNCGLGVTFAFKKKHTLENHMQATHSRKDTTMYIK